MLTQSLSSAQREKLLLEESKEDAQFHRDLAAAMRELTFEFFCTHGKYRINDTTW